MKVSLNNLRGEFPFQILANSAYLVCVTLNYESLDAP